MPCSNERSKIPLHILEMQFGLSTIAARWQYSREAAMIAEAEAHERVIQDVNQWVIKYNQKVRQFKHEIMPKFRADRTSVTTADWDDFLEGHRYQVAYMFVVPLIGVKHLTGKAVQRIVGEREDRLQEIHDAGVLRLLELVEKSKLDPSSVSRDDWDLAFLSVDRTKVTPDIHAAVKTELDRSRALEEAMHEMDDFLSDIGDQIGVEDGEDDVTDRKDEDIEMTEYAIDEDMEDGFITQDDKDD
jgi:PAS domain-containing protein